MWRDPKAKVLEEEAPETTKRFCQGNKGRSRSRHEADKKVEERNANFIHFVKKKKAFVIKLGS